MKVNLCRQIILKYFYLIATLGASLTCYGQDIHTTTVNGVVIDEQSNEPLSFVYAYFTGSKNITVTDNQGIFKLKSQDTISSVVVSLVGYHTQVIKINTGENQFIEVRLKRATINLEKVVVTKKQKRYRNRENPAVEIIEKVIENKPRNRIQNINFLEYEKYEKILFSITKVDDELKKSSLLKPFKYFFENIDSTDIPGVKLLPVYLKEDLSDYYYRKEPHKIVEIIKAEKLIHFDEFITRKSLTNSINYLYQDVDIYNNNITLFSNQFLSPIAILAPAFYKYYINDTVIIDSVICINLVFFPRNKSDLLFQGNMYVTMDSLFAIKKIKMKMNKEINLNWVTNVSIDQEFEKNKAGWIMNRDKIIADFDISKESMGLVGQKTVLYKNIKTGNIRNDSIYELGSFTLQEANSRNDSYWAKTRHLSLNSSERNVYLIMDSLRRMPEFKRDLEIISILSSGFKNVKYFEVGPLGTFYSYNPVEGSRFRLGGRTTTTFSKKIYFDLYAVYGLKDQKYKYSFNTTYSFTQRSIRDFPVKSISATIQNEIRIPGQELLYVQEDNILLSIKRGTNDKMYYNKIYRIDHLNEFENNFSYNLAYEYGVKTPAGNLFFNTADSTQNNRMNDLKTSQFSINLRYAPHEKFFQTSMYRAYFANKYPVFQLKCSKSFSYLGSDYDFLSLQSTISKRVYLSVLGYTDASIEAGKVIGHLPYLLLDIHRANQSYSYQPQSYNLMNFMEFVSDQYFAFNIDHNFNGFFFNKIPLLKKIKLREVVTLKVLYGSLSKTNNPDFNSDLLRFPTDAAGTPLTYSFQKMPYIELGFGISNIFKGLRIDFIERLTYRNHPNISKSGIRFSFKLDF